MARKKPVDQSAANTMPLALPPPRVVTSHPREHTHDPYETPPGAIPGNLSNLQTTHEPKPNPTHDDLVAREAAQTDMRARAARYNRYLDLLMMNGGNQVAALAAVTGLSLEEVMANRRELHAQVRSGIGGTDVGEVLERHDLALNDRLAILRKHAYSDNPAASLKAVDMARETEGTLGGGQGSFESFLRLVKAQKD